MHTRSCTAVRPLHPYDVGPEHVEVSIDQADIACTKREALCLRCSASCSHGG